MKKHLKFIDGTSDKFWQIEVSGLSFTTVHGKNGTTGTSLTKSFSTEEECLKNAEKLFAEKVKKGYSENGQTVATVSKPQTDKQSSLQAVLDELDGIIRLKKIDALLPFFKEKSKGHIEGLKKYIKKCKVYWMSYTDLSKDPEFKPKGDYYWGTRGDGTQQRIVTLAAIALFDKSDINSWDEVMNVVDDAITDKTVLDVLLWAKPNWLGDFLLDKIKKSEWRFISYSVLRLLESHQLLVFNSELYALCLAVCRENGYNDQTNRKAKEYIKTLVNDPITYQRDIVELFNYETILHQQMIYERHKKTTENYSFWETVFKRLLDENKMDRAFFIQNCLQIQTKEWNNNLKSFFRKQLADVKPTSDEWVQNQETIFTYFHAPYPPIVNYGVELIKQMYEQSEFDVHSFFEWVSPMMMRADCKAAIKNLFPIFEKLSKKNAQNNKEIALLLADIFVIGDMTLQERAVKSLLKIGDVKDSDLSEKLAMYVPQMQGNVQTSLSAFMADSLILDLDTEGGSETYNYAPQKIRLLTEAVVLPTDWNDILFQIGKFISSTEVLDGEILLNTFITQRSMFPQDYAEQFEPYRKQLNKKYFESVSKQHIKAFLFAKMADLDTPVEKEKNNYYNKNKVLALSNNIVDRVIAKMKKGSSLPLLSMPTHAPYWIEPKTLLERIIAHQNAKEGIDIVDLSIAISRMVRENIEEAVPLLEQLDSEMAELMAFCLGIKTEIKIAEDSVFSKLKVFVGKNTQKTQNNALWAVAARTFYPHKTFTEFEKTYLRDVPFVVAPFNPTISFKEKWNEWKDYNTKQMVRSASWYELHYDLPKYKDIPNYLLYSLTHFHKENYWEHHLSSEENVYYWQSVMPQNVESLAYTLLNGACTHTDYSSDELKGYLNIINRPEFSFSDSTMLVFACCFFQQTKDIRFMSTEVLINHIQNQTLDTALFGKKLAFLISAKYGVLLRLIESLTAIKDVSPRHNLALFLILDTIFQHLTLTEKLPTNFKKLVEHYVDMVIKTQQKPSPEAQSFFEQWKDNASLKGLIKQILNS